MATRAGSWFARTASAVMLGLAPCFAIADGIRFQCSLYDVWQTEDRFDSLEFEREVTVCSGDACFVPIDVLRTRVSCREFAASTAFDDGTGLAEMDVTLWSYCGASPDPERPRSHTMTVPLDSSRFQLTVEWDGYLTVVKCKRKQN